MKKIVYYIASSIDGFISAPNDDVSNFLYDGKGVQKYMEELKSFNTVIMGRRTYEMGYRFGVKPGQPSPAYPHMKHYIFSNSLRFTERNDQVEVKKIDLNEVEAIRKNADTDIYFCGGGVLAGWLLENQQIDIVKIKLNPLILGDGIRLFENSKSPHQLELLESEYFENGMQIISYKVLYGK